MDNRITLDRIKYISKEMTLTERIITSFLGISFYQSSGNTSLSPGTWFPFYGISDKEIEIKEGTLPIGWFIKSNDAATIPPSIRDDIKEACRFKSDENQFANNLIERFTNLPCLLISSILGGGIWERNSFKGLKRKLQSTYKDFYDHFSNVEFSSTILTVDTRERTIEKIKLVNEWLIDHSIDKNVKTVEDLNKFNLSVEDLTAFANQKFQFK